MVYIPAFGIVGEDDDINGSTACILSWWDGESLAIVVAALSRTQQALMDPDETSTILDYEEKFQIRKYLLTVSSQFLVCSRAFSFPWHRFMPASIWFTSQS